MTAAGAIAVGLALGLFTVFLALAMTGAGHGWITPFWFAPASVVLYPLALWSFVRPQRERAVSAVIVVIAIVLDAALVLATLDEGIRYVRAVGEIAAVWVMVWLGWQAVAVATTLRRPVAVEP